MSRITEVLKNRNLAEKKSRARQKEELAKIKRDTEFKASLCSEIKKIAVLFETEEIEEITVEVPDKYVARFSAAIYQEELAEYDIRQVEGVHNKFSIRRKYLAV